MGRLAAAVALSVAMCGCSLYFGDPDESNTNDAGDADAAIAPAPDATVAQSRCDTGEPNDTMNTAAPTVTGTMHELAVCPAGDVDFFAFDLLAGDDNLNIEVSFDNDGGAGDIDIRLYADGLVVDLSAEFGNTEIIDRNDLEADAEATG